MQTTTPATSAPTVLPTDVSRLKFAVEMLHGLSKEGFSEITTLASMALRLMEIEDAYLQPEIMAQVLTAIRTKATDIESLINDEAESVGCSFTDPAAERRREACQTAEMRGKRWLHS